VRSELFQPTPEGEARLLLLIDAFTTQSSSLEGRTKLAKLDFLLRYPTYFRRALAARAPNVSLARESQQEGIDSKMVRYRYGPWDPAYFALLGALIGRGLVESVPSSRGFSYRSTESGRQVAEQLRATDAWGPLSTRTRLLKRHFDLTGNFLKRFIYQTFPEVTSATWGDEL